MSIHTTIESNIHNLDDLIQVLNSQGIRWERLQRVPRLRTWTNRDVHCVVEARMKGEIVIIYQERPGEPFVFQSEREEFKDHSRTEGIALDGMEQVAHKKEEDKRQHQKVAHEQQKERQLGLHQQAADVLQRLEAERAAKRQERTKSNIDSFADSSSSGSLNDVVGKIHQQNALRKILESLETLDRDTGLYLYSQETLEDETIELTLRG